MKKYLILTAAAVFALAACVDERMDKVAGLSQDEFGFNVGKITTRSDEAAAEVAGLTIPIKDQRTGNEFSLQETISSMDELFLPEPETKGIPVYTENLNAVYKNLGVVAYQENGTSPYLADATYEAMDSRVNGGWLYRHDYGAGSKVWPDGNAPLYFFLRMPAQPAGVAVEDGGYNASNGSITFSFTSPQTASEESDILFSSTKLTESKYKSYLKGANQGAPVTMFHTLSAVKFRTASDNTGDTKTIITGVKFKNLYKAGTCTVKPDDASNRVVWSDWGTKADFSQTFENTAHSKEPDVDNTVNFTDDGTFGSSFYGGHDEKGNQSNLKNLNDEDASLTFFLIPQTIGEDVKLEITFRIKTSVSTEGTEIKHTIDFGELVNGLTWKAGEMRTYTLKPLDVDVEISDTLDEDSTDELLVANTGNVHEYIRLMITGNWFDEDGQVLNGYKHATGDDLVEDWLPDNTTYGEFDETFTGGHIPDDCVVTGEIEVVNASGQTVKQEVQMQKKELWVEGLDGYWYYTLPIGPGANVAGVEASHTIPLFESYEVKSIPEVWLPGMNTTARTRVEGVHLVMEVVVQAIDAQYNAETHQFGVTWYEAWSQSTVLGYDPRTQASAQ